MKKSTLLVGAGIPVSALALAEEKPGEVPAPPPAIKDIAAKLRDPLHLTLIRVDPTNQAIARIRKKVGRDATKLVCDIVRAKEVQAHQLISIGDTALVVAAAIAVEEGAPAWRIRGCEDTAGIGLLFGKGPGGGMIDCPVDVEWIKRRIVWIPAETTEQRESRAQDAADTIDEEVASALVAATDRGPMAAGDTTWWVQDDAQSLAQAMILLGVTDEQSGGQRLTPLGLRVREIRLERIGGDA